MELFPHEPHPRVVVGAKPFIKLPPAVVEEGAFTTSRETGRHIPAFSIFELL